jgi:hypothetical protein
MVDETKPGIIKTNGPRMLPTVTLSNGETYSIDERLNELRNIRDFKDSINLHTDGIKLNDWEEIQKRFGQYTQFITVVCTTCKKTLFNGTEEEAKRLIIYCTDCN